MANADGHLPDRVNARRHRLHRKLDQLIGDIHHPIHCPVDRIHRPRADRRIGQLLASGGAQGHRRRGGGVVAAGHLHQLQVEVLGGLLGFVVDQGQNVPIADHLFFLSAKSLNRRKARLSS
jgi:hypothetical protein